MLSLNINLVFTMINLIVFYLIIKKFLLGPVNKIMQQREVLIEERISSANKAEAKALEMKHEYEDTLKGAYNQSEEIVDRARQEAKHEYDRIVKAADTKSHKLMEDAKKTISQEREKTIRGIESEIAALAMAAAERIVGEKSGEGGSRSLYDQFLTEAGGLYDADGK